MARIKGVVRWFNDDRGYGFITPDGGAKDCFVHHSQIQGQKGRRKLEDNDVVEFEIEQAEKGPAAVNVTVIAGGY